MRLGPGWADLLAVEEEARLVVIEIKLARNAEARRAVVAQETVETETLASHLSKRGVASLFEAVSKLDQTGSLDEAAPSANLAQSLAEGRFRLVLGLDPAPTELVRSTSYLQRQTEGASRST